MREKAVTWPNHILHPTIDLTAWELELNKKEKEIRREIRKLKLREPDLLEYRLEIESGHFIAYEINAHIKISLFEVP